MEYNKPVKRPKFTNVKKSVIRSIPENEMPRKATPSLIGAPKIIKENKTPTQKPVKRSIPIGEIKPITGVVKRSIPKPVGEFKPVPTKRQTTKRFNRNTWGK